MPRRSIGRTNKLFFCRYFIFPRLLNTNVLLDNRRDVRDPDQFPWWCLFVICFAELHSHWQAVHCRTGMHHHGGLPGPASKCFFSNTNLLPSSQRHHEFGHFLSVMCGAPLRNDPETRLPGWLFPAHYVAPLSRQRCQFGWFSARCVATLLCSAPKWLINYRKLIVTNVNFFFSEMDFVVK